MYNWFVDKNEKKSKTTNEIMDELKFIVDKETNDEVANHWIDDTHNVFAFINDNGDNDRWIEIHYELYDCNEEIIGDLLVLNTENVSEEELLKEITIIVNTYYGD